LFGSASGCRGLVLTILTAMPQSATSANMIRVVPATIFEKGRTERLRSWDGGRGRMNGLSGKVSPNLRSVLFLFLTLAFLCPHARLLVWGEYRHMDLQVLNRRERAQSNAIRQLCAGKNALSVRS
jgi:hypothetical protein